MKPDWTINFNNDKITATCLNAKVICDLKEHTISLFDKDVEISCKNSYLWNLKDFNSYMHEAYESLIKPDFNRQITKEALAEKLHGREYPAGSTDLENYYAADNGLIVIFGFSDDQIYFRGKINEEVYVGDDTDFIIVTPGVEIPYGDDDSDIYLKSSTFEPIVIEEDSSITENRIKTLFSPAEIDCTWLIKTDLPHASFDIMEDGELYCRGIIIDAADL